jgi:ATP adenylyltransferase
MFRERADRKNHILHRGKTCAVVMNRYPYSPGHLMIAPRRHVALLTKMTPAEMREMMELTQRCNRVLDRIMHPHGYNIGINLGDAAGAGLRDHVHTHIVPRWNGDTNFMPVLADVKVMPQALDEIWDALHGHFKTT